MSSTLCFQPKFPMPGYYRTEKYRARPRSVSEFKGLFCFPHPKAMACVLAAQRAVREHRVLSDKRKPRHAVQLVGGENVRPRGGPEPDHGFGRTAQHHRAFAHSPSFKRSSFKTRYCSSNSAARFRQKMNSIADIGHMSI